MRRLPFAFLLVVSSVSSVVAAQQSPFPPDSAVLSIIKQRVAEKRSAGIVVGLLEPNGKTRVIAFGDAGPAQPPLDANSVFEIGSISKVFTATVLAQLVGEGKVRLEDPAQKYVPNGVTIPSRNGKQIMLSNLSEQNSALPRMPSNFKPKDQKNPYADYGSDRMYEFLSGYELTRDPGEKFEYSNLGVGLLGNLLASVTKQSYEQMELERVWKPLGMTHTAITLSPWMRQHLALGHDGSGAVTSNWDLTGFAGAGGIRSTATDMLKFAEANLHPERGPLQKAMAFAHQPRSAVNGVGERIGLNWFIHPVGHDTIIWHNGGTGGYTTFLGLDQTRKIAVVILTNSGGEGADDIGRHLLSSTVPLAPLRKVRVAIEVPAAVLERYVGVYELEPTFSLTITVQNGALFAQGTGQEALRIWPETNTDFFSKAVDAQFSFVVDAQGVALSLVLHQGGQDSPAKKVR